MATIRQRGNKWQCLIRRINFPEISKTFINKEDAKKWARAVEREMDLGEYIPKEAVTSTLADLLDRYEKEVTPSKRSATKEIYRLAVIRADKISKLNVKALTPADVANFRDRRLANVKATTVLHDLCTMSAVFEHARLEWSLPIANPVRAIRKPAMGKGRDRRLHDGEYERLLPELEKCRNKWVAPLFVFSVETACRRGEALKLKWSDVDLGKRLAIFRETKNGENRVIPLSTKAIQTLEVLPHGIDDLVFPVKVPTLRSAFEHACERAKIKDFRWHDARHEGVSRLHERGLTTVEVASVSGHKTLACLARYSHMNAARIALKLQ